MKNLLKKFGVMIASLMLVMTTFAMPSFAVSGESTTLKVEDVESSATVSAYKVVEADSNGNWKMVDAYGEQKKLKADGTLAVGDEEGTMTWVVKGKLIPYDFEDPSSKALTELAKIAKDKDPTFDFDPPAGTEKAFTKTADKKMIGSYLVLVTPADPGTVYNPMLVSVSPEADGVNTDDNNGNKISANATKVHAKKSTIPFEKVVERSDNSLGDTYSNTQNGSVTGDGLGQDDNASATDGNFDGTKDGNKGDTAGSKGGKVTLDKDGNATFSDQGQSFDNVAFRINSKLPNYADNYFKQEEGKYPEKTGTAPNEFYNPKFIVNDELSDGLDLKDGSIKVKVEGKNGFVDPTTALDEANSTFKIDYNVEYGDDTPKKQKDFVITFAPAFLKANAGKAIEICYAATLNKDHGVNFDQETNTAELHYTNAPGEDASKMDEKETYHYTFTINGKLEGDGSDENREVIKIGLDGEGNRIMHETVAVTKTGWKPLQGVEFKLYKANAAGNGPDTEAIKDVVTDKNGVLRGMDQIDAGVYYLVETSVGPNTEYAKDTTPIRIEITPTLDDKGRMTAYQVKVGKDAENMITVGNYVKDWSVANPEATTVLNAQKTVNKNPDNFSYTFIDNDSEAADIVNTKVGTLPSTGGMGTILFTVGGIVIMGLALLLLFGGKRRQHQK